MRKVLSNKKIPCSRDKNLYALYMGKQARLNFWETKGDPKVELGGVGLLHICSIYPLYNILLGMEC